MTCIVGLVHAGHVFMGGDSAGSDGYHANVYQAPKVFRNGEFLIGYTTSFRMGQLLEHSFHPPLIAPDADLTRYMVTSFVDAVRECLKRGGFARKVNEVEEGGCFLVGLRGHLFTIDSDYQVLRALRGEDAIGSGARVALGALFATHDLAPAERIARALEAAQHYAAGVRGPFSAEVLS